MQSKSESSIVSCSPLTGPGLRHVQAIHAILFMTLLCAVTGCSISTSISDSVSSPFKSSSDSSTSSPADRTESYLYDIRDYTEAYVKSSSDIEGFKKGLASIAEKHGVTNWEADQTTFRGIGKGLAKAGATQMQVEVYKTNLAMGDPVKSAAIQKGYGKNGS